MQDSYYQLIRQQLTEKQVIFHLDQTQPRSHGLTAQRPRFKETKPQTTIGTNDLADSQERKKNAQRHLARGAGHLQCPTSPHINQREKGVCLAFKIHVYGGPAAGPALPILPVSD